MPTSINKLFFLSGVLPALLGSALLIQPRSQAIASSDFDVIISHGRIVDGTGDPWFRGDVGIQGDRIKAIGKLDSASARTRIDATNLVVSPGFIDMLGNSEFFILIDNRAASKITQGITTEVTGEWPPIAPINERMIEESSSPDRDTRPSVSGFC